MPLYRIQAPDGKTYEIEGPPGASQEQVAAAVLARNPEAAQAAQRAGVLDEVGRGAEQLVSDTLAGVKGVFSPNEAAKEAIERSQGIGKRYGESPSLAGVSDVYQKEGLGAAAKRVASDAPRMLAQNVPNLAALLAAGKLGAMAGSPLGPVGSAVGAGLAGTAAMLPQFMGQNIASQAQEQQEQGRDVDVNRGTAGAAAAGQAALEGAGTAFTLGKRLVSGLLGIKETAKVAETAAARAALKKAAERSLTAGAAQGAARGLAEIPVEVAQQVLQRAQAGQELFSDDAYKEYAESAYGAALVGPATGGLASPIERSGARKELRGLEDAERRKAIVDAEAIGPQAETQVPLDVAGTLAKAQNLQQQIRALTAQKIAKPADEIEKAQNAQIDKEVRALAGELKPLAQQLAQNRDQVRSLTAPPAAAPAPAEPVDANDELLKSMGLKVGVARGEAPQVSMAGIPGVEAPADERSAAARYAADQAAGARNMGIPDVGEYVRFLMRDPEMARQVVAERPLIEGLDRKATNAVYGAVQLQLKERDKAAAAEAKAQPARRAQLLSQQGRNPLAPVLEEAAGQRDMQSAARAQGMEATRAMQERVAGVEGEEQAALEDAEQGRRDAALWALNEQQRAADILNERAADRLVGALPRAPETAGPGRIVRGAGASSPGKTLEELQADLVLGQATRNRELVQRTVNAIRELRRPSNAGALRERMLDARSQGNMDLAKQLYGEHQQALKDESNSQPNAPARDLQGAMGSRLPEGYAQTNAATRAAAATTRAIADLANALRSTPSLTGRNEAAPAAQAVKERVLAQANARREAQGQPALSTTEAIKLTDQLNPLVKELMQRWSRAVEPRVGARPAQMRGPQVVESADPGRRPDPGQRAFGSPSAALETIRGQIDDLVDSFSTPQAEPQRATPQRQVEGKPRVGAPAELQLGAPREPSDPMAAANAAVDRLLGTPDRQIAQERVERNQPPARSKDLKDLGAMLERPTETTARDMRGMDQGDLDLLRQAQELLTPTGTEFSGLVREQAERVMRGLPADRQVLQDAISAQRQGRASDEGQRELFGRSEVATERASPQNFQRYLDSKEVQSKREAERTARQKVEDANRAAADEATRAVRAREAQLAAAEIEYQRAKTKAAKSAEFVEAWKDEVVARLDGLDSTLARWEGYRDDLHSRLADVDARALDETLGGYDSATAQELDAWKERQHKWLDPVVADLEGRIGRVTEKRDAVLQEIDEDAPMLGDHEKFAGADSARERQARDRLKALRGPAPKELQRERVEVARDEATQRFAQALQNAREGMGLPGTRVTKDTTASAVEKRALGLKRAIGSLNEQIATARAAGDDVKVDRLEGTRDNAMTELASVFETAPQVRTNTLPTEDESKAFAEYEAAQRAQDVAYAKFRASQGIGAPALNPRRKGPALRNTGAEPRSLRTTSEESLAGENVTGVKKPILQGGAAAPADRNRGDYQSEANRIAEELRGRTRGEKARAAREARAEAKETERLNRPARGRSGEVPTLDEDSQYRKRAEGASDALSDTASKALRENNISAALNDVANNSKTPLNRAVAKRLRQLLNNTTVVLDPDLVDDKGAPVLGAASGDGMTIWLNPDTGLTEETLLHEAVHAATERVLRTPESQLTPAQLAAKRELTALWEAAKRDSSVTSADAKGSLSEFVAEALSNPVLQKQLAKKPWRASDAWQHFKRLLLNLLGVNTPPTNMLDSTLAAVDTIMQAPRPGAVEGGPSLQSRKESDSILATPRTLGERLRANLGLAFRTQFVDSLAPMEGVARQMQDSAKATQMMYYGRMFGQRMSLVSQAASRGALTLAKKARKDGRTEFLIESKKGASLKDVADEVKGSGIKDPDRADQLFSLYLIGRRAQNVGWEKLDFSNPDKARAEVQAANAEIDATPGARKAFERAASIYNAYNKDMLRFLVDTDALSEDTYKALVARGDYVPFYRQRRGNAELVIGSETPIRIGNLKDSPHLRELVGGDDKVLPFSISAVQNTSLLTDLALRNITTKNLAMELASMHMGRNSKTPKDGAPSGSNVIEYKDKGEDRYAIVDTDAFGVPADLLVKGLAGIPTMLPAGLRVMGVPSQWLRKLITASPVYAARQLVRDSTAAAIASGANITPVVSALRQLGRKSATQEALESRGVTGGAVFTGASEDMSKVIREMMGGGNGAMRALSKFEALTMEADATTRRAQYDSYRKKGLSEMEATLMSLESMNFTRRGISPTVQLVGHLVPFFNAQIQGLDVLWRTIKGDMPLNEQLKLRQQFISRGLMLAGLAVAYAAGMSDDETYKNATPEERANNFFVRLPGVDEAVRIPVPFEIGYIFKSLPEAVVNMHTGVQSKEEGLKTLNRILVNTLPGGSNLLSVDVNGAIIPTPLILPAVMKPVVEAATGTSLFTRRALESEAEKAQEPGYRSRENTSEIGKQLGELTGMSPIVIENTVRGYTGSLGIAFMQLLNGLYPEDGPEKTAKRLSELPVLGPLFQPKDGRQALDMVYEQLKKAEEKKATFESMVAKGERAKALEYLQENSNEMAYAAAAGSARQQLGQLSKAIKAIQASDRPAQEKRALIDDLKRVQVEMARAVSASLEKR